MVDFLCRSYRAGVERMVVVGGQDEPVTTKLNKRHDDDRRHMN